MWKLVSLSVFLLCFTLIYAKNIRLARHTSTTTLDRDDEALLIRINNASTKPLKDQSSVVQEVCLSLDAFERKYSSEVSNLETLRGLCKIINDNNLLNQIRLKRDTNKCLAVAGGSAGLLAGTITGAGLGSAAGPGGVLIGAAAGFVVGFVSGAIAGLGVLGPLCTK